MMKLLPVGAAEGAMEVLKGYETRPVAEAASADLMDLSAVVVDEAHGPLWSKRVKAAGLKLPVVVISQHRADLFRYIDMVAEAYENSLLPPFTTALMHYVSGDQTSLATPGHHEGEFFRKTPGGRIFYDFFGPNIFRADVSSSDAKMGDPLTHEGYPLQAAQLAAKVFHADQTYFVLNGTSSSNKVCCTALLTPGDLVLFDRNNHKSMHQGALIQSGAVPVYLETARNPYGFIGGIMDHCLDEDYIRSLIKKAAPGREKDPRPFRLACIQLGTYDGILSNARQIVDRIGPLCDYILFDSAWVGYEQFIPMIRDTSPLLLNLTKKDPGILVTQSVHKQLAGFSQVSQIQKKDYHLKGQTRYVRHAVFNNAFLMNASTSPCYPLFASLEMNAKLHEGERGRIMWMNAVRMTIELRKKILQKCRYIRPFVPPVVDGKPWESYDTDVMAQDARFFEISPARKWHGFEGIAEKQYYLDPCKLLLYTEGIDLSTWDYKEFGIPSVILSKYLQDRHVTPEKCDLYSILFLITPGDDEKKLDRLVADLVDFETAVDANPPLEKVLPWLTKLYARTYSGMKLRDLCRKMHDFFRKRKVNRSLQALFEEKHFPPIAMNARDANEEFVRGNMERVPIRDVEGRIALEGALAYPPGIFCVVPGERWTKTCRDYFLAMEDCLNELPGLCPEIQGIHTMRKGDRIVCYAWVLKDESIPTVKK